MPAKGSISTAQGWRIGSGAARGARWLRPLHEKLLDELRTSPKLFADETTTPALDPSSGRTKTGQLSTDVFIRLVADHPVNRLDELLPWSPVDDCFGTSPSHAPRSRPPHESRAVADRRPSRSQ
jgi:hypothetical protein